MFGSITFLPLYFQTVDGATPTSAGLRLLPMMVGLLITSILSGQLISRRGHYRAFPIFGTAVMAVGLMLLSQPRRRDEHWLPRRCICSCSVSGLGR